MSEGEAAASLADEWLAIQRSNPASKKKISVIREIGGVLKVALDTIVS